MFSHRPCGEIPALAFLFLFTSLLGGKEEPKVLREIKLQADLTSEKKAIPQVQAAFGKYSIETPELFEGNHRDFEHLVVEKDKKMEAAFVFRIHRDKDGDRDKIWPKGQERQRNEIKGYQSSPKTLKALHGEVTRYHWYLKIDESFAITKNFCHFFQLKPVGEENSSDPLLTLSGSIFQGKPQLEIRLWSKDRNDRTFVADWKDCKGKWLECECIAKIGEKGFLRFSLASLDNTIRFAREFPRFATWRPGISFIRPKWGIYRSLANKEAIPNEEDEVRMTNFTIQKLSRLP
tara:strand:- start:686 stop:1558 length:873 start_codon:yes stop_codon:yes gene_type:complete